MNETLDFVYYSLGGKLITLIILIPTQSRYLSKINVIHTLGPGIQMMDSVVHFSTKINEIFRISFF